MRELGLVTELLELQPGLLPHLPTLVSNTSFSRPGISAPCRSLRRRQIVFSSDTMCCGALQDFHFSLSLSLFFFPGKPSWLSACVLCWEITGRVPGEEQFRRIVAPHPSPFLCGDGAARTPRLVFTKGVVSCKWASGKQVLSEESLILQFEGKTEPNCVATSRTLRLSQTYTRAHVHTSLLQRKHSNGWNNILDSSKGVSNS